MNKDSSKLKNPWSWVPSLYFAEGMPYMIITTVSVLIFKQLGMSVKDIAFFTSFMAFPWALKPLWAPILDVYWTKKRWVILTQASMAIGFALAAFAMPFTSATQLLLWIFLIMAFVSATHDAAADGFYIIGLPDPTKQAFFTGVRSTAYRVSMITAQGGMVLLAGLIQARTGLAPIEITLKAAPAEATSLVSTPIESTTGDITISTLTDTVFSAGHNKPDGEVRKDFLEAVNNYNAHPTLELLNQLDAPVGMGMLNVYYNKDIEQDKDRQLSISGESKGDLKLLNGDFLQYTSTDSHLPRVIVVEAVTNIDHVSDVTFKVNSGNAKTAWFIALITVAILYGVLVIYHLFMVPNNETKIVREQKAETPNFYKEFAEAFITFFQKKHVIPAVAFILLYRFAESQLLKIGTTFMVDAQANGGLALSNSHYGMIYGVVGVISLIVGGILGGWVMSRQGLRFWMIPMALALNIPDLSYFLLSWFRPESVMPVILGVTIEQFGYGFGFTMYMMFMVFFAEDSGKYKTSHFAIMTGLMAVGMILPGMLSGEIYELLGKDYFKFFSWVMISTIVSFSATYVAMLIIPKEFGRK